MNTQRAKEISESADQINVTYEGTPVFIQHVDEQNETARIYPLNKPDQEKDVPLTSLVEQ